MLTSFINPAKILNRYNRKADGTITIDVSIESISDLYNFFDRKTSYSKRDLDEDFVDYLIECLKDIRQHPFEIKITVEKEVNATGESKIKTSIKNYFLYMRALEIRRLKRLVSQSVFLLLIGLGFIALSVKLPLKESFPSGLTGEILSEGIIIAAWVSLWGFFANIITEWIPYKHKIDIYSRISNAKVLIISGSSKNRQ